MGGDLMLRGCVFHLVYTAVDDMSVTHVHGSDFFPLCLPLPHRLGIFLVLGFDRLVRAAPRARIIMSTAPFVLFG